MSTSQRMAALLLFLAACGNKPSSEFDARVEPSSSQGFEMKTQKHPTRIDLKEAATIPRPGTVSPRSIRFVGKEGKQVTYLFSEDKSLSRQLYSLDLESGEKRQIVKAPGGGDTEDNLSPEEKLERERRRERGIGITRYAWSKEGDTLLIPLRGDLHVQSGVDGELRKVVDMSEPALSPRLSRDGSQLAFVADDELYSVATSGGTPKQLTSGARGTGKSSGLAEYIAQEEMGRYAGYWWSEDGKHIAFTEVDETHIPTYRIVHQGEAATGESAQEDHGYPFAGKANAKIRLGVVPSAGGKTVWMDLGDSEYLARVHWMPNGELWAQLQNREQTRLDLVRFDLRTGQATPVLSEESKVWINLHRGFRPLRKTSGEAQGGFIWASERTGFKHLYLYSAKGELLRALTAGEWPVDGLVAVDEEQQRLYFSSGRGDPTQRQVYSVGFDGGDIEALTKGAGSHGVRFSEDFGRYIHTHSSMQAPSKVVVRSTASGEVLSEIHDASDERVAALKLEPPGLVTLTSRDGVTLHGAIYAPPAHFKAPYPTVVSVYGGPHAQRVSNSWSMTVDMRAQYLRERGYLVFKLDNRGSARRGLAFEGALKHDMGNIEIQDQVDGVQYLIDEGLTDAKRVAIYGWSYGGYLSAMALARAPETFRAAVAGAPVTHWDGYDTHYTERYMGTPESNSKGYLESSVMHHLGNMKGKLMLVHGLIDENVHFRHTARLVDALIKAGKHYELLLFPNERHMPRALEDRVYMESRIETFLNQSLNP